MADVINIQSHNTVDIEIEQMMNDRQRDTFDGKPLTGDEASAADDQIFEKVSESSDFGEQYASDKQVGKWEFAKFAENNFDMTQEEALDLFEKHNKDGGHLNSDEFKGALRELETNQSESLLEDFSGNDEDGVTKADFMETATEKYGMRENNAEQLYSDLTKDGEITQDRMPGIHKVMDLMGRATQTANDISGEDQEPITREEFTSWAKETHGIEPEDSGKVFDERTADGELGLFDVYGANVELQMMGEEQMHEA